MPLLQVEAGPEGGQSGPWPPSILYTLYLPNDYLVLSVEKKSKF
ncbi:hypothetical protein Zm00014a_033378 [Zea mays]|uniref:Uncharacterized protein n=1 Tax=Zea mays TaxID=4577 RepID=A0A3L6G7R4_MAIZE|nr:hypothetical protein Zm00014a_033378 [Zea mays]